MNLNDAHLRTQTTPKASKQARRSATGSTTHREADVLVAQADLQLLLPHAVRFRPVLVVLPARMGVGVVGWWLECRSGDRGRGRPPLNTRRKKTGEKDMKNTWQRGASHALGDLALLHDAPELRHRRRAQVHCVVCGIDLTGA